MHTPEVAASYDIFPTAMALAGAELPADRVYDGRDISALLLSTGAVARSPHDCLYIYKGTPGAACPEQHPNCPGLWAMRCGRHKIHWVTANSISPSGFSPYPTAADTGDAGGIMGADVGVVGRGLASSDGSDLLRTPWDLADLGWQDDGVFHDPPLIFDLEVDPSERFALDATSAEHAALRAAFEAARAAHEATLAKRPPENQMAQGGDPALALCCDPRSKERCAAYHARVHARTCARTRALSLTHAHTLTRPHALAGALLLLGCPTSRTARAQRRTSTPSCASTATRPSRRHARGAWRLALSLPSSPPERGVPPSGRTTGKVLTQQCRCLLMAILFGGG